MSGVGHSVPVPNDSLVTSAAYAPVDRVVRATLAPDHRVYAGHDGALSLTTIDRLRKNAEAQ